jgi:hypothetical protein
MFSPGFAEHHIFPLSNIVNEYQPLFLAALIAISYSLYRNYKLTKFDNKPIFRTFWRSGIELQLMLWGTLASIMFNLGMLFSESIEAKIGVSILAGIMIGLNIDRQKIVDVLDKKWILYVQHRQHNHSL